MIKFYNLVFFSSFLCQVTESSRSATTPDNPDPATSTVNTFTLDQPLMDTPKNTFPVGMAKHSGTDSKVQEEQKEVKVYKSLLQFGVQCCANSLLNFLIGSWNYSVCRQFEMCYKFSTCIQ